MSHHPTHSEHHQHSEHHEHQEHANHPEVPRHQNEITARAPVDAPEAEVAEHQTRPAPQKPEGLVSADTPLVPTEAPVIKPPIQSMATPAAVKEEVVHPVPGKAELLEAEEKIAPYIGANLSSDLTEEGLDLNFKEYANGNDKFGIKLCFQGPALTTKSAELGHQVLAALRSHTAFAPLFHNEHTRPHTHKGDQEDMMHVLITNLDREQYIELVDKVRGIVHAKEEPKHHGTSIAAPQKKEHAAAEATIPQNIVQGPVAALEKGVNDNEIAPQGVAL